MTTEESVYILIHPDGRAEWGDRIGTAEKQLGPDGIVQTFLDEGYRLRIAMSDCARALPEEYALNPYAVKVLAYVAGVHPERCPETRGPVILFGWDPRNERGNARPLTADERNVITEGLAEAGCTVGSSEGQ